MATQIRTKPTFALVSEELVHHRRFERVKLHELIAHVSAFCEVKSTGRITIDISEGGISTVDVSQTELKLKTF